MVRGQLPSLGAVIQDRLESGGPSPYTAGRVSGNRLSSTVGQAKPSLPRRTVGQFYEERQKKTTGQFYEERQQKTTGQFYQQRQQVQQQQQTTGQEYSEFDADLVTFVQALAQELETAGFQYQIDPAGSFISVDVEGEEVGIHPHRVWDTGALQVVVDSGAGTQPVELDADAGRIVSFLSQDRNYAGDEEFGMIRPVEPASAEYGGAYSPLSVGAQKAPNSRKSASKIAEQIASELSSHQGLYGKRVSGVTLRGNHVHFACDNNKVKATVAVTPEQLVKVTLSGPQLASSAAVITDIAHAEPQKIAEKIVNRVCRSEQLGPTVGNSPLANKLIPNMPTIGRAEVADAAILIEPNALELALLHAQDIKGDDALRKYTLEIISLGRNGVSKIYVDKKKESLFHTDWDGDPTSVIALDEELFIWLAEWSRDICEKESGIVDLVDAAWYRAGDAGAAAQPLRIKDFAALVELSKKLPPRKKAKKTAEKTAKKKPAKKKAPKKAKKKAKKPAKAAKAAKKKTAKRTARKKTAKRKTTTRGRKS